MHHGTRRRRAQWHWLNSPQNWWKDEKRTGQGGCERPAATLKELRSTSRVLCASEAKRSCVHCVPWNKEIWGKHSRRCLKVIPTQCILSMFSLLFCFIRMVCLSCDFIHIVLTLFTLFMIILYSTNYLSPSDIRIKPWTFVPSSSTQISSPSVTCLLVIELRSLILGAKLLFF